MQTEVTHVNIFRPCIPCAVGDCLSQTKELLLGVGDVGETVRYCFSVSVTCSNIIHITVRSNSAIWHIYDRRRRPRDSSCCCSLL